MVAVVCMLKSTNFLFGVFILVIFLVSMWLSGWDLLLFASSGHLLSAYHV